MLGFGDRILGADASPSQHAATRTFHSGAPLDFRGMQTAGPVDHLSARDQV